YYIVTEAGHHHFTTSERDFNLMLGSEAKQQLRDRIGRLPDEVIACVGGGSNAIGIFADFIDEPNVDLVGVEPAGKGMTTNHHGATLTAGRAGVLHGCRSKVLQTAEGQISASHSVSAGLDYPGVGPQHAYLQAIGRAQYVTVEDHED